MKRLIGLLLLAVVLASAPTFARARGLEEFYIYPFVEGFVWKEFDTNGKQFVKETGPLYGVGAAASIDIYNKTLMLKAKGDIFGGVVDYDGNDQLTTGTTTTLVPLKTDVNYVGARLESDLGWRFGTETASLEPFAGLGFRWWRRDIQSGTDVLGNHVTGYTEEWSSYYTRLGLRLDSSLNKDTRLFAEAGGKYPFYTSNYVNPITVEPKGEWSAFAELGMRYKWFRPSLFYEGFSWSASDWVFAGVNPANGLLQFISQPKSESHIFGLNLGIAFK